MNFKLIKKKKKRRKGSTLNYLIKLIVFITTIEIILKFPSFFFFFKWYLSNGFETELDRLNHFTSLAHINNWAIFCFEAISWIRERTNQAN